LEPRLKRNSERYRERQQRFTKTANWTLQDMRYVQYMTAPAVRSMYTS